MSSLMIIEISVPLANDSVIDQAEAIAAAKEPLAALISALPNGTVTTSRIVKGRADAGKPRAPRKRSSNGAADRPATGA